MKNNIGKRVRKLRQQQNMTQKELANILGIANNTLSNYENGNREIDNNTLISIANQFNVSTDYLLGHSDITIPKPEHFDEFIEDVGRIDLKELMDKYEFFYGDDTVRKDELVKALELIKELKKQAF